MSTQSLEYFIKTSESNETFEYHSGYLAKDRFYNVEVKNTANLAMRSYEQGKVVLFQKRISYASGQKDPVFSYIAKKI